MKIEASYDWDVCTHFPSNSLNQFTLCIVKSLGHGCAVEIQVHSVRSERARPDDGVANMREGRSRDVT